MTHGRPILRLLGPRSFWLLGGILALIEAIYIAEHFSSIMEFIVSNGGGLVDTLLLAFLRTPEVIDFALPIAILISVYFAILNARDSNELVVCASAGVPWTRIPRFAFFVGVIGLMISLLFSTMLTPLANKAGRIYAQTLEARTIKREITEPGAKHSVRQFEGNAFIATPSPDNQVERGRMFVFQPDKGDGWRASHAQDWTVLGPREDGSYALKLLRFRDFEGRTPSQENARESEPNQLKQTIQNANWNVENLALAFRLDNLTKPIDLTSRPHEKLLFVSTLRALWNYSEAPELTEDVAIVVGRAIGCIWAALLAVAAAAFSNTRLGRYTAVPVGVLAVMGGDVAFRTLLLGVVSISPLAFAQMTVAVLACAIILPLLYVYARKEAILIPRRGAA